MEFRVFGVDWRGHTIRVWLDTGYSVVFLFDVLHEFQLRHLIEDDCLLILVLVLVIALLSGNLLFSDLFVLFLLLLFWFLLFVKVLLRLLPFLTIDDVVL